MDETCRGHCSCRLEAAVDEAMLSADAYTQKQAMMGQLAAQQEESSRTIPKACL